MSLVEPTVTGQGNDEVCVGFLVWEAPRGRLQRGKASNLGQLKELLAQPAYSVYESIKPSVISEGDYEQLRESRWEHGSTKYP